MQVCEKAVEETSAGRNAWERMASEYVVCFVCTGNTCRSPMAAALLNDMAERGERLELPNRTNGQADLHIRAVSAGLFAQEGMPISDHAVAVLEKAGIENTKTNPYRSHKARQIREETVRKADLVIGISSTHAQMLRTAFPNQADKICALPYDVSDPFGGDEKTYAQCLDQLTAAIRTMFVPAEGGETV